MGLDGVLEPFAGEVDIATAVARVAAEIDRDHPDGVTVIGVLKASTVFLADLVRRLTVPTRVEFVAVTTFDGATDRIRVAKDVDRPMDGEAAVLVTGTIDTGLTTDFLRRHLSAAHLATLRSATLADKSTRRLIPESVDYRAFTVPDTYLVGYGLDFRGRFRNLPALWRADLAELHRIAGEGAEKDAREGAADGS